MELGLLDLQDFARTGQYFWKQMQVFNVGYINYANIQGEFIGVERLNNGNLLINETLQTVQLDEKLLRHIFTNLLSNAIKYSPTATQVDCNLMWESSQIIFQIQDRGIGIPVSDRENLFDSFHRATNVGNIAGTGLGLAIVKKAVEAHRGKIWFETQVGMGTKFIVAIPLVS